MKVIKNKDNYSITMSEKEVNNLIRLVDLSPILSAFSELKDVLLLAKQDGKCEIRLKNWNFVPPLED